VLEKLDFLNKFEKSRKFFMPISVLAQLFLIVKKKKEKKRNKENNKNKKKY
jgi:hypothetical protein